MRCIILGILIFSSLSLTGQQSTRDDMLFYADVMITASEVGHRVKAADKFYSLFNTFLHNSDSKKDSLTDLKWISKLSVPGKFRLFTWQIDDGQDYPCSGFLLMENGRVIELKDKMNPGPDIEFMRCSPQNWFGHIYYHIEPIEYNSDSLYILFGYDANSSFNKRKVIEVLSFEKGEPVFGKELFKFPVEGSRDLLKYRVGFEYSADAVMGVNYNPEMNLIVFDHLQQVIGQIPGQGPTMVPDGTYEGLSYDGEFWIYNEKLFHEILDEAPRPKPILDGEKKDIMGRKN